jgi:nucleotide-binding universal stress UspA family protein
VLVEEGVPHLLLRDYVRDQEVDLLVLGTHERSAFAEILLGSTARVIMDHVPCDALLIRELRAAGEA